MKEVYKEIRTNFNRHKVIFIGGMTFFKVIWLSNFMEN